jgi:hypothetical protein
MLKKITFFVILVCLIFLTTLLTNGYCDDWVYVVRDLKFTYYYNLSSVKIDKQHKTIQVWEKEVYTDKGKMDLLNKMDSIERQKFTDLNHRLILYLINYKNRKYSINYVTYYSNSDNILFSHKYTPEWHDIISDSVFDFFFNKLIKDYNIQR